MNEPNHTPTVPEFKDRSTGLLIFGILDILLGAGCVLMVGLMFLGQIMSAHVSGGESNLRMLLPAAVIYSLLAVVLVWLGIGSIKRQRWARALLLILSWSWLMVGLFAEVMMLLLLPHMFRGGQPGDQEVPQAAIVAGMLIAMIFMGVLFVVIPGIMVFFYGSRHVKATCETGYPQPCWTDACPLPVLAVSCWLWFGCVSMLLMPLGYHSVLPFFGALIAGLPGTVLFVAFAALWAWLGWMCYKLQPAAWWILVAVLIVFAASNAITFARVDLMEMYQKMGYPEEQIEIIRKQGWMTGRLFAWWMPIMMVPMLGYLVWVKRFFSRAQNRGTENAPSAA